MRDSPIDREDAPAARNAAIGMGIVGIVLLGLALAAAVLAIRFVETERERDLRAWQVRLGIVAASRAAAIDGWLAHQKSVVRDLAENAALQIYMTELELAGGDPQALADEPAQAGYLRNLLQATADREGFATSRLSQVQANVARPGGAGLALVDQRGRMLVRSAQMPPPAPAVTEAIANRKPGQAALVDLFLGLDNEPMIGFIQPVFPVQVDPGAAREIGLVLSLRPVADILADLLMQPGETLTTAESLLVRLSGGNLVYLTRLGDGASPLKRSLSLETPGLAEARLVKAPGDFVEASDYANRPVLATSRALGEAPWVLIRKVESAEAMAETRTRTRTLTFSLLGAIAIACLVALLVWRHGTSLRAAESAHRYRTMAARFEGLNRFLKLVTDGQPTAIAALDRDGRVSFVNRQAAAFVGLSGEDALGKDLSSLLGPARAKPFEDLNRTARETERATRGVATQGEQGREQVLKSDHIPLGRTEGFGDGGVLMVIEDITELMRERGRRERTLRNLVATLVAVVDRRDPYSAHHSARVAEVARAIAGEMQLDTAALDTVEIAAALMNLGKIGVPTELLTKTAPLDEAEIRMIRDSVLASADLLEGVEFDGPVVETLRQMQEHWDGSGQPKGLAGETILLTARIVAVANAFVGMTSARAYRPGRDVDVAASLLIEDAGRRFDRRPVMALVNLIENRGMRDRWRRYGDMSAA